MLIPMKTAVPFFFFVSSLFIACSSDEADILPGSWKMIRIETLNGELIQAKKSSDVKGDVILELQEAFPTAFTGRAVCNSFQGNFEISEKKELMIEKFSTTYVSCPSWGHAFENRIRKVISYDISKQKYLYLILEDERMVFQKIR